MKISRDAIQQFFTQTVPEAGKAAKSRFVNAWNTAAENRQQKTGDRKIRAAVLQRENWKVGGVAEKYSAPIKLLTERVRTLGASSGEERAKNMLSTNEVCLLLCCWQRIHQDGYKVETGPAALKELVEALIAGGLLREKNPGEGYVPWLPHDQINSLSGITTYIQDLQKTPTKDQIEHHFAGNEARLAIPSYLLDVFSPLVLIPRSNNPPLEVHEDDIKLLQALTPSHPSDFKDARDLPIILNTLATLTSDSNRRAQFLKWWDASPIQPVTYGDGQITAQTAFFARTDGQANHKSTGIHEVIDYIRSIDSPEANSNAKDGCIQFIKDKLRGPLSEASFANMEVSKAGRAWLEGLTKPLTDKPIRLDDTQYKMYMSLERLSKDFIGEELQELIQWMKDPDSLEKLKVISQLKRDDLVLFPGEEMPKADRNLSFRAGLLVNVLAKGSILTNLEHAYANRFDPNVSRELLDFFSSLKELYGTPAIEKQGGRLTELMREVDQFIRPLNHNYTRELDLRLCKTTAEEWATRDSWTAEQMYTRYTAMSNLGNWLTIHAGKTFPAALIEAYPKLDELQKLPANVQELAKACGAPFKKSHLDRLDPKHPLQTISNKIIALTKTLPEHTRKEDRLTMGEFNFLKVTVEIGKTPYWLTAETFAVWKTFAQNQLQVPKEPVVLVNFVNPTRAQKLSEKEENVLARIKMIIISKVAGSHADMTMKNLQGKVNIVGMGLKGYFSMEAKSFVNPKIDQYELDLERLARGLPEEKRKQFPELFQKKLLDVTEKKGLLLPTKQNRMDRYKKLLQIQPRLDPSKAGFTEEHTTSFCSEFVMRSIMEATVLSFQELGISPPETARYFGLNPRANLLLLSPAGLERCLKREGLLKPLNNIEQIIRF